MTLMSVTNVVTNRSTSRSGVVRMRISDAIISEGHEFGRTFLMSTLVFDFLLGCANNVDIFRALTMYLASFLTLHSKFIKLLILCCYCYITDSFFMIRKWKLYFFCIISGGSEISSSFMVMCVLLTYSIISVKKA